MPYVRIWIHLIWSTKNRVPLIGEEFRSRLFAHMKENAQKREIRLDLINGAPDHTHALVSLRADQTVAKVAQLLKGESSHWVNEKKLISRKFEWQDEYIAVSVSESMVETVREYIRNQAEHHRKKSFGEEFAEFMQKYRFEMPGKIPCE